MIKPKNFGRAIGATLAAAAFYLALSRENDGPTRFRFVDGGRAEHRAALFGSTLRLELEPPLDVQLDREGAGEPGRAATGNEVGLVAYALLVLFRDVWRSPVGARVGLRFPNGRRLVAIYEVHPADASKPYSHPGVGVRELAGANANTSPRAT